MVWWWRARLPERKDQACRVLVRGARNSCLVEFPDGFQVVTSRWAVRRRKEEQLNQDQLRALVKVPL